MWKINNHLELKNLIKNYTKDSATVLKRGYYKNLKQTLLQKCQDTEEEKAMMFKYDTRIDTRGKKEITKEMKEAEIKKLSFKDTPDVQGVTRHDVKDAKQWKARRDEPGKLGSSRESTRRDQQPG